MAGYVLLTFLLLVTPGILACNENTDCYTCTQDSWAYVNCRWCALTNECHAPGSVYNHCTSSQQVSSHDQCGLVTEPPIVYQPETAKTMAKWSSFAYMDPHEKDLASIQNVVAAEIGSSYRILEYVLHDCDAVFEFPPCAALVAISDQDDHLVVAFRGTKNPLQLVEQVILVLTGMEPFGYGIPGEVLRYNKDTHESLYPCVKSIIEEQLRINPRLRVSVTGHSLGGAQASLTALHLLIDGLVPDSRLELYSFGQPRLGNSDFAFEYDRLIGNSWRLTNVNDPVPKIIPSVSNWYGYHTRREVFYNVVGFTTSTGYKLCRGNEDHSCAESETACLFPSCIAAHQRYFLNDLPSIMSSKVMDGGSPPTYGSRGQCMALILSP